MIPVSVHKITFHPPSRSYAVILKEIENDRSLPVIVGSFEAQSIALAMEHSESTRPLTHDLIGSLIQEIESKLTAVKITDLIDGVFYARMEIKGKLVGDRSLDARPSDAIVIALRMDAPILVDDAVMKEVGVLDEDIAKDVKEVSHSIQKHLEEQLVKAVEVEDYERAAVIRDKIKELSI
jgi:hypothetical protein